MRKTSTASFFFIAALLFQGLAAAWQFPSLQVPLIPSWLGGSSTMTTIPDVPKFILDARHPWLAAHARELAELDDPTSLLCTRVQDIAIGDEHPVVDDDGRGPGLDVPQDFFRRLEIDNNRGGVDRPGWENARDRLREMRACPRALAEVRELKVDLWVHDGEPKLPPADVPRLFAEVLGTMAGLERLDWALRGYDVNVAFGGAFAESGAELGVKELTVNMYATWLLDACPSPKVVDARNDGRGRAPPEIDRTHHVAWLKAASKLKELKGLNLGHVSWQPEMTQLVPELFPDIEELWVGPPSMAFGAPSREEGDTLKSIIKILAALSKLNTLHLPGSANLDLGFDGGPWCGNAYMDEGGDELWRQVRLQNIEATERAGEIVREGFSRLKGVDVGDFYGNFTMDADGAEIIIWPWTGRLEEWLKETN